MANELIAQLGPRDLISEGTLGGEASMNLARSGDFQGCRFRKNSVFSQVVPISHANTFTTGVTITFILVDDGTDAADLGKVIRIGVTPKRMVTGESTNIDVGAAAETTLDVTLQAVAGNVVVANMPILNAALDSLATGEALGLRIRRVGNVSQDTCNNPVILLMVAIKNT